MPDTTPDNSDKRALKLSIAVIVLVIGALLFISWLMTRGAEDNRYSEPRTNDSTNAQPSDTIPPEPTNPNVTGGSSGAGNVAPNDPNVQPPSPAGGVDTNQIPAGGTSDSQ